MLSDDRYQLNQFQHSMSFLSTRYNPNADSTLVSTPERLANPQRSIAPKIHFLPTTFDKRHAPKVLSQNSRQDESNLIAMLMVQGYLESVANVSFVNKLIVAKNLMTYVSAVGLVYMASSKS